ncbi:MAG: flavodoxin domain-containing protein [Sphaerochaetaceae bacterium]
MKIAIRYYSKLGHIKKLAEAIASVAGVEAKSIEEPLEEDVDILFFGSSIYAAGIAGPVKDFINNIDKKIGKIVNFSTAGLLESTYKSVKKVADAKGLKMADEEFHCKGQFTALNYGHPNNEDIENVKSFTKKVLKL